MLSTTSFLGFSPTLPTEQYRERDPLSVSRSVGRVGENPGNEVVLSTLPDNPGDSRF